MLPLFLSSLLLLLLMLTIVAEDNAIIKWMKSRIEEDVYRDDDGDENNEKS